MFSLEGFTGDPTPGQSVLPIFRETSHTSGPQSSAVDSHTDTADLDHLPETDVDEMDVDGLMKRHMRTSAGWRNCLMFLSLLDLSFLNYPQLFMYILYD